MNDDLFGGLVFAGFMMVVAVLGGLIGHYCFNGEKGNSGLEVKTKEERTMGGCEMIVVENDSIGKMIVNLANVNFVSEYDGEAILYFVNGSHTSAGESLREFEDRIME